MSNNNLNEILEPISTSSEAVGKIHTTLREKVLKSLRTKVFKKKLPEEYPQGGSTMTDEAKYLSLLNIFSHSPYTLSSSPTYSASTLSSFLSSSSFNSLPQIQSLVHQLLTKLSSYHKAFLIADTTLLRKTGSKIEGTQKLYDPYSRKVIPAHRALVIVLWTNGFRIPLYAELLHKVKPVSALISALKKLLPLLRRLFPNLVFLCDAGITCNRLLNFLLSQEIDFVMCHKPGESRSGEQRETQRPVVSET